MRTSNVCAPSLTGRKPKAANPSTDRLLQRDQDSCFWGGKLPMKDAFVGWKGELVRLVPPDRSLHLENALRWMNDPAITATLELNRGVSRKQEEAFFVRIETQNDTDITWAI